MFTFCQKEKKTLRFSLIYLIKLHEFVHCFNPQNPLKNFDMTKVTGIHIFLYIICFCEVLHGHYLRNINCVLSVQQCFTICTKIYLLDSFSLLIPSSLYLCLCVYDTNIHTYIHKKTHKHFQKYSKSFTK